MKIKVAKWGNSLAVRLPSKIAEELRLVPGDELELSQEGKRLVLANLVERQDVPAYRPEDMLTAMDKVALADRPKPEDWSAVEAAWPNDDWSDIAPNDIEWAHWNPDEWKKRVDAQRNRS